MTFSSVQGQLFVTASSSVIFFGVSSFHVGEVGARGNSPFKTKKDDRVVCSYVGSQLISCDLLCPSFVFCSFTGGR